MVDTYIINGWWFGTLILFFHSVGIISTIPNSDFSEGFFQPPIRLNMVAFHDFADGQISRIRCRQSDLPKVFLRASMNFSSKDGRFSWEIHGINPGNGGVVRENHRTK